MSFIMKTHTMRLTVKNISLFFGMFDDKNE